MSTASVEPGRRRRRSTATPEETDRLVQLLVEVPPFSVLHPDDLRHIAGRGASRTYHSGDVVFRAGEPARKLYVIDRGQVKLSATSPSGRERLVAILGRGQIFGELEMFDGALRGTTARAMDDVQLFLLDRHLVQATLRTRPAFVRRLLELMARRLRRADQAAQDLVFFDAPTRLARRLLTLAGEHGVREEDSNRVRIDAKITQQEVGQMIGLNRSSVNRVVRSLTDQGLIDWNGGSPVLLDVARLTELSRS